MTSQKRNARFALIKMLDNENGIHGNSFLALKDFIAASSNGEFDDILDACESYGKAVFLDEDVAEELRNEMDEEVE